MKGELHKSIQSRLDSVGGPRGRQQTLDKPATKVVQDEETLDSDLASQKLVDRGDNPECPECSNMLTLQEGCIKCLNCGYSEC
jgi:ribonucleoside-diphosphate reductase alpha chain